MAQRDIVVIGASAGGVSALEQLIGSLPEDFPASIFIVLHTPPHSPSKLPQILSRAGKLEAVHPEEKEQIEQGKIYVAPPDRHLMLEEEYVTARKGPKENRFRPSIDALFRSAAYVYGTRVIGVVLTGSLDDGTSGLWTIKRLGGLAVCQDPEEAPFPEMPKSVQEYVETDYTTSMAEMGPLLTRLVSEPADAKYKASTEDLERVKLEVQIATKDNAFEQGIMEMGDLAPFTCPSCHGALVRLKEGTRVRYRCHTGHSYSANSLLAGVSESVEETLWQAMRGLEEITMLLQHMGEHIMDAGDHAVADRFMKKANETAERARIVHDSVFNHERISGDFKYKNEGNKD